jgi:hypothetical protein
MYVFSDGDRTVSLADVDLVAGEGATVRFLSSREEALDVFRAVGGNLALLETILAAAPAPRRRRNYGWLASLLPRMVNRMMAGKSASDGAAVAPRSLQADSGCTGIRLRVMLGS